MIASHSCCRFVVCTSMMWISRSTTSQRCSIGLRSADCGGHLSKVNSLSCSRNQSEMIWALWHGSLSCWKYIRRWYTVVIKGWTWSATILRSAVAFKRCSIGTQGPKVCQENIPHTLHHHHKPEPLRQGRMDPCFHDLYAKFVNKIYKSLYTFFTTFFIRYKKQFSNETYLNRKGKWKVNDVTRG